jgi:molybdate transport system substrate-binding protein
MVSAWPGMIDRSTRRALTAGLLWFLSLLASAAHADTVRVAVASNFANVAQLLADVFEASHAHDVVLSIGATGKHYAQIVNGAPFDLFLAADRERPERLDNEGLGIAGTRFTYAIGGLVAWAPGTTDIVLPDALSDPSFGRVAIANPRLAPYGRAAQQALQQLDAWEQLQPRLVRGENVGQALQFVHSGNAAIGLVARAQLVALGDQAGGTQWPVPAELYTPIEQQAILLRDRPAARSFHDYLRSDAARGIIQAAGYTLP